MHAAIAIALLGLGVAAILVPRPAPLRWAGPPLLALVALALGVLGPARAGAALRPLLAPLAFVAFAVPFAVLLDRAGLFHRLAERAGRGSRYLGACWVLAGLVVALLNLDAAVVLLAPLYVRLAERRGTSRLELGFQPILLSCLASSALPISNLTNLIAGSSLHLDTAGFLVHLGLPTLAATAAGWWAYLRVLPRLERIEAAAPATLISPPTTPSAGPWAAASGPGADRRLVALGLLVAAAVAGFLVAPSLGGQPWEVAAAGDLLLVLATRSLPLAALPWRIVLSVAGLGVLASAATSSLHFAPLLAGGQVGGIAKDVGLGVAGAGLINNLPALLVALPGLAHHRAWGAWGFLLGTNVGPLLLPTASLAGLLWLETLGRLSVPVRERHFLRLGWRIALPALLASTTVLLLLRLLLGRAS